MRVANFLLLATILVAYVNAQSTETEAKPDQVSQKGSPLQSVNGKKYLRGFELLQEEDVDDAEERAGNSWLRNIPFTSANRAVKAAKKTERAEEMAATVRWYEQMARGEKNDDMMQLFRNWNNNRLSKSAAYEDAFAATGSEQIATVLSNGYYAIFRAH